MKQTRILFLICALPIALSAQKYTISGYLRDGTSGEPLISANIFDQNSDQGTVTNVYGFYSLTLPADSVSLSFSYIGYEPTVHTFLLRQDTSLNIDLGGALQLEEVVVRASRQGERIEERSQMSQVTVPVEQIKQAPVLLGETDVLKTLQLLPGVQSGGEGQTGLYVRGGSPDQNLVLLDGVPVYNTSHLLGIFSVFNADAVKNVTLTKGGFPARYGGRLSSILEINMKEGNLQEWHGEGSIGMISSRLTLEGPIKKDKTSILLSGRRTYADVLFRPIVALANQESEEDVKIKLHFYDLNAKVQHKFNDKHRLFLSAYLGADVFFTEVSDGEDSFGGGIDWGNSISALRWNWQINNKLFANTTLTYSRYQIDVIAEQSSRFEDGTDESFSANYFSGIEDWAGRIDFDYIPVPGHYIKFGGGVTNHTYRPGALSLDVAFDQEQFDTLIGSQNEFSDELFLYIEDDMQLGKLKANVGLHGSGFSVGDEFYTSLQ
ncbi:MAG: TonB-dependent receptor plug domain-containing protein, partial [Phaeodactylibacter sp.]|nr:TonB-dependent receptor plug domain-containing protein [Phaeodactylibacter sp.]